MASTGLYLPYSQTGSGMYGESWGRQTSTFFDPVKHKVLELVKTIPFTDKRAVFNIGDYGSADGAASMTFIRDLIITLRKTHRSDVQFQIIYEDQAINDFNSLFKRLAGVIPDPPSYLKEFDNVYPMASGINFYKQCVPSDSMHFIMSVASVHWLSKPLMFKHGLYIHSESSCDEREALNKQADQDWESFLLMRSKELKKGGIMLVITTNRNDDDDDTDTYTVPEIFSILSETWISFKKMGKITNEEFNNGNLSLAVHSLTQLRAPFDDISSDVSKSGLRLLSSESATSKNIFYAAWKEKIDKTGVDHREEFVKKYVAAVRNWSNHSFLNALSDSRTQQQRDDIVEDLYKSAVEIILKKDPWTFPDVYLDLSCIIITKE